VKDSDLSSNASPRGLGDEATVPQDSGSGFTPGAFFKEAGTLIAVCLGLSLLMQILLA